MNVEALRLLAVAPCESCSGTGAKVSEDWEAFQEWRTRHPVEHPEDEDDQVEQYFLVVCDMDAVPPMRTDCPECKGTGAQRAELDVRELLEFVFEHVDRPAIRSTEIDEMVDRVKHAITEAALRSRGMQDGLEVGTWLRAVQEGAQALESLARLRPERSNGL